MGKPYASNSARHKLASLLAGLVIRTPISLPPQFSFDAVLPASERHPPATVLLSTWIAGLDQRPHAPRTLQSALPSRNFFDIPPDRFLYDVELGGIFDRSTP